MPECKISDLKKGDKIIVEGNILIIKDIQTSAIAKHGKVKRRMETINEKTKEKIILVRLADDIIELKN